VVYCQFCAPKSATAPSAKTLGASVKTDTTIIKLTDIETTGINIINQATVCRHDRPTLLYFLFFSTAHFFKTILASRTNGTFAFAPTHKTNPSAKSKEPFFANAPLTVRAIFYTFRPMKRLILLPILFLTCLTAFSQSYLGQVTKQVNFREGPGTEYGVIASLKAGTQIFIVSLETDNDFYNIIDIATDKEGYIHKSFVKVGQEIEKNEQGMFTPSGQTDTYNPEIQIYNNTKLTLTLKLNSQTYSFAPQERKTITMSPGACNYRASAPGVIPNIGTEYMQSNQGYTWQFYKVTERR
jgi:hypothetical protein